MNKIIRDLKQQLTVTTKYVERLKSSTISYEKSIKKNEDKRIELVKDIKSYELAIELLEGPQEVV